MLILVASCRSYSDSWIPFGTLFERFWPDCAYRKVLFSDDTDQEIAVPGFSVLMIGSDQGWIQNLLNVCLVMPDEQILLMQEDFFLNHPVDSLHVQQISDWFERNDYDCCRLYPCPGGDEAHEIVPGIGEILPDAPFHVSCQAGIWKRESLVKLCRRLLAANRTKINEFEHFGSMLVDDFKLCGVIRRGPAESWPLAYLCSGIADGKWMSGTVRFCMEQGIRLSDRPVVYADSADEALLRGEYAEWLKTLEVRGA